MQPAGTDAGAFRLLAPSHREGAYEIWHGQAPSGRPVTMVLLSPQTARDQRARRAFAEAAEWARGDDEPDLQVLGGDPSAEVPWMALAPDGQGRGVARFLDRLLGGPPTEAGMTMAIPPLAALTTPPGDVGTPPASGPVIPPAPTSPTPTNAAPPPWPPLVPQAPTASPVAAPPPSPPQVTAPPPSPPQVTAPQVIAPPPSPPQVIAPPPSPPQVTAPQVMAPPPSPPQVIAPPPSPPQVTAPQVTAPPVQPRLAGPTPTPLSPGAPPQWAPTPQAPPMTAVPSSNTAPWAQDDGRRTVPHVPGPARTTGMMAPPEPLPTRTPDTRQPADDRSAHTERAGRHWVLIGGFAVVVVILTLVGAAAIWMSNTPNANPSGNPSSSGAPSPTPAAKYPTYRASAPIEVVLGPTFLPEDATQVREFADWPFAFRTTPEMTCDLSIGRPEYKAFNCRQGTKPQQIQLALVVRQLTNGCSDDELAELETLTPLAPGNAFVVKDGVTRYADANFSETGRVQFTLLHCFGGDTGKPPTSVVIYQGNAPADQRELVLKIANDIRSQTG